MTFWQLSVSMSAEVDPVIATQVGVMVNGTHHQVPAEPDETMVDLLRNRLGLTGTKLVCGAGVCGACTVQVDGTPMVSCLLPCATIGGRSVITVEGLSGTHPVQRAFAAHDGLQCGYCTPGFVVEAVAYVDRWRAEHGDTAPSRAEIADAMAGHLCRCGAYEGIYAAISAACTGAHDADGPAGSRVEAMDKITGRATYTTDVKLPGQLEGVIIRSTSLHAVVGTVRATATEGTVLVELLPPDRTVRYRGQPVAAVAGPSVAAARAAAAQVLVEYDELPAVLDIDAARRPDAPVLYPSRAARRGAPRSGEGPMMPARWHGNVRGPTSTSWRGGTAAKRVDLARERRDPRLVSETFTTAVQTHTALEPHVCVASWDPAGDLHL